jgi:MinD-like ATPase involved in chromosome partitioning or flagellar assembly
MYVVTFYSYKGGVGRSMALVNVGYQLASAGRTVLLVDFDLEAPGLHTFNLQRPPRLSGGVVDFVGQYLDTGEVPSVTEFVYKSESFENGGAMWIMPAGKPDDEPYSANFQNINWQELYDQRDGFLLFEDLKEQWRTSIAPDYVLIDSRTGHTDIAGICTRQLPDSVCILFFPNEQNLSGLRKIVADIRFQDRASQNATKGDIALHFVVSNVPTLDDEDKIVATRLRNFSEQLKYKELAAQIHHYDSLALLNQLVFCKDRPNSYLAKEYTTLADAIRRGNLRDRETALEVLRRMVRSIRGPMPGPVEQIILSDDKLRQIAATFPDDGEILFWLALAWRVAGDAETAFLLFDKAIEKGYASREVYFERGLLKRGRQEMKAAIKDFWCALRASNLPIDSRAVLLAVQEVLSFEPESINEIASSWSVANLPPNAALGLAIRLSDSRSGLELCKIVLSRLLIESPTGSTEQSRSRQQLGLTLIGLGEFQEAITCLNPKDLSSTELEQATAFNLAMANWGATTEIARNFFARVAELDKRASRPSAGPNYPQCLAITHWAIGDIERAAADLSEARRIVKQTPSGDFSAWRYQRVDPRGFERDLDEIELLLKGENILPKFMSHLTSVVKH